MSIDAERLLVSAFDHAPHGMSVVALDGSWLRINDAYCDLVGYSHEQLRGLSFPELTHPDDVAADLAWLRKVVAGETERLDREKRYIARDGSIVWVHSRAEVIHDAEGRPASIVTSLQDITGRRAADEALRASEERLMSILRNTPDAVCVQDLKYRYLLVNEAFERRFGLDAGWAVGRRDDEVLAPDALVVDREFHDRVVGNGELVVQEQVVIAAGGDRVYSTARFPLRSEGGDIYGVCSMLRDVTDLRDHEEGLRSRLEWTDRIHAAVAQDRFVLHAQPIINLASGEVEQAELLIRLIDRLGSPTLVPPCEFLPAAERFELVGLIDRWVVERGVELARDHRVELNLSGQTISDPEQIKAIERLVIESGAPPENIIFEITETAVVEDTAAARHFAQRLRGLGCAFALDDFGVGFGSFTYLKHLPVDYLKIDIDFVRELVNDEADRHVVSAIVGVARNFGIQTVAEGVEDQATLDLLREMEVDYAQGFWIGRPIPIQELWPTVSKTKEKA